MNPLQKIDFWTKTREYEFNFQLWGEGNNCCYINKDDVEIAVLPQRKSSNGLFSDVIKWCEKHNPKIKYPNQIL